MGLEKPPSSPKNNLNRKYTWLAHYSVDHRNVRTVNTQLQYIQALTSQSIVKIWLDDKFPMLHHIQIYRGLYHLTELGKITTQLLKRLIREWQHGKPSNGATCTYTYM